MLNILKIIVISFPVITCSHILGAEITPRRVVSLAPSYDETLIELGLQDRIIGVTTSSDYLEEVKNVERVGLWINPNIEKIIALKPDLVLAAGFAGQQSTVKQLSASGLRVVVIDETQGLEEILVKTKEIGDIVGAGKQAKILIERMRKVIEETARRTAALPSRPRVYVEVGYDPLFTCGKGSFIHDLIEIAGGENIAGKINSISPGYRWNSF
jgi:iron complex transport system substrate-binding protein